MTNLKRGEVSYRPFEGHAILADGLLAVQRPAGEVAASLSQSLFGAADVFAADAERIGRNRIEDAANAVRSSKMSTTISGGDRGQGGVVPTDETIIQKDLMPPKGGSNVVNQAIARAAAKYGQSPSTMRKIAMIESGLNPNAKNPSSSAAGLFQQIDDNAAQYGVNDRLDPYQSSDGAARFMRDSTNYLAKRLGRAPTEGEIYLAHQQGGGGAYELLKDPSALAVNVIGRERVLKNGGNVNMTAGQFAAMWTSKLDGNNPQPASNGFGAMPTIDLGDNSFDVKPAERSALEISFKGDAPSLTGRDTIWGRAYDKAVTNAYSSKLQNEMLTASDEIAQKYADDPIGMREAFSQLKEAQLQHDVPDSIRADYENAHGRIARSALVRAQKAADNVAEQHDKQTWLATRDNFQEGLDRSKAGYDNSNPDTFTVIQGQAQRLKEHLREGVARGVLTPEAARSEASRINGDVAAQWYVGQARGKTPEEVDALRQHLQTDYAAGKLPGVDGAAWATIDGSLNRVKAEADSLLKKHSADLKSAIEDDRKSLEATGKPVAYNGATLDFETVRRIQGDDAAKVWQDNRTLAHNTYAATAGLERQSNADIEARVHGLVPQGGESGFADKQKVYEAALRKSNEIMKLRSEDPALAAQQAVPELAKMADEAARDPTKLHDLVVERMHWQSAIGVQGSAQLPLTKEEAKAYSARINMVEDNPDALDSEMHAIMDDAQKNYGTLGDEVMLQILGDHGIRKQTAASALGLMGELNIGRVPDAQAIEQYSTLRALAHDAMMGDYVPPKLKTPQPTAGRGGARQASASSRKSELPNAEHIALLKSNPTLAPQFDQRFGQGSADTFLKDHGDPIRRKLANGDTEMQYADGYVETFHADGTIDGRPAQ
jgi:Transglycosylase SLT domain